MKHMIALLFATVASPALAQDAGHTAPGASQGSATVPALSGTCTAEHAAMGHCTLPKAAPPPAPACTAEHAAMGHCKLPAPTAAPAPAPAATCTPEHAAMGHCTLSQPKPAPACTPEHSAMGHCKMPEAKPSPAPATTCTAEHAAIGHCTLTPAGSRAQGGDPHAGHAMPGQSADPHAGHNMGAAETFVPPVGPAPAEALSGPAHAQDLFFNPQEAERSRRHLNKEHGGMTASRILVDQLEASFGDGREGYAWDAQFWYGGDYDKLWVKTEGEGEFGGEFEGAEVQALWSRAIDPWFDVQAGVRQDFNSGPDRTHLVLGVQGLAPYWFEVDGALFISNKGDVTARAEAEYDLRLTQRLILQPLVEADFAFQNIPDLGIGSGLSTGELGARLRIEFWPKSGPAAIAPYVGVAYERAFGDTADFRRAAGEDAGGWRFIAGIRTWF